MVIPIGLRMNPEYRPTFHLTHDWIIGLVYIKIAVRSCLMMPETRLGRILSNVQRNGLRDLDVRLLTSAIIMPTLATLTLALTVPLSLGYTARKTLYRNASEELGEMIYHISYPAALITCLLLLIAKCVQLLAGRWRLKIRDEVYLTGELLHNYGEAHPTGQTPDKTLIVEDSPSLGEGRPEMLIAADDVEESDTEE